MKHRAFILLGSNLGDRRAYLEQAKGHISEMIGPILMESSIYVTAPWQLEDADDFYNQAIEIETALSPQILLDRLLRIEEKLGRIRSGKVSSRTIDLDIAFYDNEIISGDILEVPHPRLHLRNFALAPLNEMIPEYQHPLLNKTIATLLSESPDESEVTILAE